MYCIKCGARVDTDAHFCQHCGTAVKRVDESPREREQEASTRSDRGLSGARRKAEDYVRDPERTRELLAMALSKAGARRNTHGLLDEIWEYLQVAARLIPASVRGDYTGLSRKSLTLIVAAIIYYVSPIDLIPDFIPIAGLLDDVTVLAFALRSIKGELDAFKDWEARQPGGRG